MVRASLIASCERLYLEFFKDLERFKYTRDHGLFQHACEGLALCGGQPLQQKVDAMLLGNEAVTCIPVPNPVANVAGSYLPLAVVTHPDQLIDHMAIVLWFP